MQTELLCGVCDAACALEPLGDGAVGVRSAEAFAGADEDGDFLHAVLDCDVQAFGVRDEDWEAEAALRN